MRDVDIAKKLREQGTGGMDFIKWWRREEDFIDFDMVERFLANVGEHADREIEGYELTTQEEVWDEAKRLCGERLSRTWNNGGATMTWMHGGRTEVLSLTPQNLLKIIDEETGDNYVD